MKKKVPGLFSNITSTNLDRQPVKDDELLPTTSSRRIITNNSKDSFLPLRRRNRTDDQRRHQQQQKQQSQNTEAGKTHAKTTKTTTTTTTSYWHHRNSEIDILQQNIEYPGKHPHERHLQEKEEEEEAETPTRYNIRPNSHDGDDYNNNYNLPYDLRNPGHEQQEQEQQQQQSTIAFDDDDFDRHVLSYYDDDHRSYTTNSYSSTQFDDDDDVGNNKNNNNNQNQNHHDDDSYYQPLRIHFLTSPLEERRGESDYLDRQIDEILQTSLPEAASVWTSHLSVYPVSGSIEITQDVCYGSFASSIINNNSSIISNTDIVIVVSAQEELKAPDGTTIPVVCGDSPSSSSSSASLAVGAACTLDQWDRPIIGFINLCLKKRPPPIHPTTQGGDDDDEPLLDLDQIVTRAFMQSHGLLESSLSSSTTTTTNQRAGSGGGGGGNNSNAQTTTDLDHHQRVDPTSVLIHEMGHIFGFDSYLFKFYRDGRTGEPLTPRPFDSSTQQSGLPSSRVIQLRQSQLGGDTYFEIVTQRVVQVVRNFFDCQSMAGARLENYDCHSSSSSSFCVGSHWDERNYISEILSPALAWRNNLLTPLTLALMEDTGWYKVNYERASMPTFGLGAGCDFVDQPCIVDDRVPPYARDYFCDHPIRLVDDGDSFSIQEERITCDPGHQYWSFCDLWDSASFPGYLNERFPRGNRESSYFSDKNLLVSFPQADFCPLAVEFLGVDCTDETTQERRDRYLGEEVGPSSRCVNAFSDISEQRQRRIDRPACMHVECDATKRKVVLGSGEYRQVCDYDGQVLQIPSTQADYLECPRLATICPHLFCPAACSGRGICDYSAEPHPKCHCFNKDDTSEGCYKDDTMSRESASNLVQGQHVDVELSYEVDSEFLEGMAIPMSGGSKARDNGQLFLSPMLILFPWFL